MGMHSAEEQAAGTAGTGTLRRRAAIIGIVLLAGLYLATFLVAVFGGQQSARLLRFCLGMTIFLPIFLWVVIWCVGIFRKKKSIASLDLLNSDPKERRRMEEAVGREMRKNAAEKNG
mgnify:CR=1 FL=1